MWLSFPYKLCTYTWCSLPWNKYILQQLRKFSTESFKIAKEKKGWQIHRGIVAIPLSNFGMFSGEVFVTCRASLCCSLVKNLIKVILIEELVQEIFHCSLISKAFGWTMSKWKIFPRLFLATWRTNESHFVALVTDFQQVHLRRCFHYYLLRLHLYTILDPNNPHFQVS